MDLDPAKTYELTYECTITKTLTIQGNGAVIRGTGPVGGGAAGTTVTFINCTVQSTGWGGVKAKGGCHVVVKDSRITCPNGTGIYVENSNLTVENTSITSCYYGVNIFPDASGSTVGLHGISIQGIPYAVQVKGALSSLTIDQGSSLSYSNGYSTGVGILQGASAVIRDSTLAGFDNAIDIPSGQNPPGGTVQVYNCRFSNNLYTSLSVNDAWDVLFSGCLVENAQHDGIYINNSTAVVENSTIMGSLNSGVAFLGCGKGGTIRNCLVTESAHQGLAIVEGSQSIQVIGNTFSNNMLANLFVDSTSKAYLQGNIFARTPAPNSSLRLHGPIGVRLDSALVVDSGSGMEVKDNADPTVVLSAFSFHDGDGVLNYGNARLTAHQSHFWSNGASAWSVFVNTGAMVTGRYCALGPAGDRAFYNNAGTACDMRYNYWASTSGPNVGGTGSGSRIEWNPSNGSQVSYDPFLTQAPVENSVVTNLYLQSGGNLTWDSGLGVKVDLTARTGIPSLMNEIVGVLRVNDTGSLSLVIPPEDLVPGQFYAVWVGTALRMNSASGSLVFSLPSQQGAVVLARLEPDCRWVSVPAVWNPVTRLLTYSPSDLHTLNGTFAVVSSAMPPGVGTGSATSVTPDSAVLNGSVNPGGQNTAYYFEYGLDSGYGLSTPPRDLGPGSNPLPVSEAIQGLIPNAEYRFRLVAENASGKVNGNDQIFSTYIVYVEPKAWCGDKTPCYSTIRDAVSAAPDLAHIWIAEGSYVGDISFGEPDEPARFIDLRGGWDSAFTQQNSAAGLIQGIMEILKGGVLIEKLMFY